jgi:hypothetical protein
LTATARPSCQHAKRLSSTSHSRTHRSPLRLHRRCSVGRSNPVQSAETSDSFGTALALERRVECREGRTIPRALRRSMK